MPDEQVVVRVAMLVLDFSAGQQRATKPMLR